MPPWLSSDVDPTAVLRARAVCERAGASVTPSTYDAVLGALEVVACAAHLGGRAGLTTVLGGSGGARASPFAGAAGLGAGTPSTPRADDAIFGAEVAVAILFFLEVGAQVAAVGMVGGDGTGVVVKATVARFGATAVSGPFAELALDGAGASVAGLPLGLEAARLAAALKGGG